MTTTSRRLDGLLAAAIALCAAGPAIAQGPLRTSPSELLANPGVFDGKAITLSGAVVNLQGVAGGPGQRYQSFDLSDGTQAVHVLALRRSRCNTGRATVDGTFDGARRQVTAMRIRCR